MLRLELIITLILATAFALSAQNATKSFDPTFTPFEGTVYKMPVHRLMHGFKKEVYSYEVIKTIKWDDIQVSDRHVDEGFPEIDRETAFGIIFKSQMLIPADGYYKFSISSDDGSIIWIDDKMVVHNDYHHGMKLEESIVQLTEGVHEIKIWYYQAYVDRFGVEFESKFMKALPPAIQLPRVITIQDEVLFDHDKYDISYAANHVLDSLSNIIRDYENVVINIDGHTDTDGTDEYNIELSNNRSAAVRSALMHKNRDEKIKYISKGHSYNQPVASNDTEEGKAKNRRVVITITKDGSGNAYFKEKVED